MKNLNILFYILTLPTFFTLTGCGSSDDYWQMEDPKIVVFSNQKESFTLNQPNDIMKTTSVISSGSHLYFKSINDDVTFNINTKCELGNKFFHLELKNQKIHQKLFFYNYLPTEVIAMKSNIKSDSFICDFKISASNSVDSKIKYDFSGLKFSTINPNKIRVGSSLEESTIRPNGYFDKTYVDITREDLPETAVTIIEGNNILHETKIICDENTFAKDEKTFGLREFSINQLFKNFSHDDLLYYKNCRVLSYSKLFQPTNKSESLYDIEKVWSPYFDVILRKPNVSLNVNLINSSNNYFSDNNQSYTFEFAELEFFSKSNIPTFIKLKNPTVNANFEILHPYFNYRSVQVNNNFPSFRAKIQDIMNKRDIPSGVLKGSIETKINFITGLEDGELIDLSLGKTHVVSLQAEKNFSCSINKKRENGLWLQAITPYSQEDQIEVYVFVNNQIEKFPMPFYLSEILNESHNLNLIPNSKYVFDALLLPKLRVNSFKNADNHDEVYRSKIQDVIKYSYSKNISEYKRSLAKEYYVNKTCRIFED